MNQLEKATLDHRDAGDVLDQLAGHDILLPKRDELEAYLAAHPELAGLLDDICKRVRAEFGPAPELALERYHDPETGDSYLTLYVRQEAYGPGIINRIEAVSAEFHDLLEAASGYFLFTTDFRRPLRLRQLESVMIQNDHELKVTRERVTYLLDLLARLRVSARPEELRLVSSGYRAEVERMQ